MEKVEIPKDLYVRIERVARRMGFGSVEEFTVSSIRRLLDRCEILLGKT